jgi:hypothetical protein
MIKPASELPVSEGPGLEDKALEDKLPMARKMNVAMTTYDIMILVKVRFISILLYLFPLACYQFCLQYKLLSLNKN